MYLRDGHFFQGVHDVGALCRNDKKSSARLLSAPSTLVPRSASLIVLRPGPDVVMNGMPPLGDEPLLAASWFLTDSICSTKSINGKQSAAVAQTRVSHKIMLPLEKEFFVLMKLAQKK